MSNLSVFKCDSMHCRRLIAGAQDRELKSNGIVAIYTIFLFSCKNVHLVTALDYPLGTPQKYGICAKDTYLQKPANEVVRQLRCSGVILNVEVFHYLRRLFPEIECFLSQQLSAYPIHPFPIDNIRGQAKENGGRESHRRTWNS